jgi:sterol desaturase/sphingolipid hydroxylase (fatty acid hydroxylase superfamily)
LTAIGLAHAPLFVVAPFYTSTVWYCLVRYRHNHRHAHLDPAWARDHLPWHYDHHMGDQAKNFGVAWAWFDVLAGTREVFVGSERERAGLASHVARALTASAGAALRAQRRNPLRKLIARTLAAVPRTVVARAGSAVQARG